MANIVISRIQHRRGRRENLPQPLLPAEIALTSDTSQAWMGQDPILAVPSINVYADKLETTAQGIVDNNIVETRFDENMTITIFNTLVAELKVAGGVTLVDDDILWDDTYRGTIETITVTTPGSGYTTGDAITAISATGSGFIGTVTAAAGAITGVVITNGGTNYRSANTTFSIASGTGGVLSVAVTDIYGSTVHIAADPTIDPGNTVANITSTIAGLSATITNRLLGSAAFGGTFVSNSLIVDNHTEAANVAQLINRVNGTTPGEITGLTFTNLNAEITGAGIAGSSLGGLSDVDLTGAADNDMLYRSGGNWVDTAGELTWNSAGNYLQLANVHSINWQDSDSVTQELLTFTAAGAGSGDPDFNSVVLLANFDGADTQTTFTEASTSTLAATFVNNAELDTAQKVFGTASLLCDGIDDYITFPSNAGWDFADLDFTVEFRIRYVNDPGAGGMGLMGHFKNEASGEGWYIANIGTSSLRYLWSPTGFGTEHFIDRTWNPSAGVDYAVAITRSGDTLRMFIDGVQIGADASLSAEGTTTVFNPGRVLDVGQVDHSAITQELDGWLDEVRITKGIARYTANYTIAAQAFLATGDPELFIVGDPLFDTIIDGFSTTITSTLANIDGALNIAGSTTFQSPLFISEQAAADIDILAEGQIWVRDDAPNTLMFTDDVGTDFEISGAGVSDFTAPIDLLDNEELRFGDANDILIDFDTADFNIAGTGDYNVTGFTDMVINARIVPDAITNPTESVTTTNVITADESGKTFFLNLAAGFTSTLPVPAAGLKYKFFVSTAPTTSGGYIITTNAGANILQGTFLDIVGELQAISARDVLTFVFDVSLVGDSLEVESDGTSWFCTAFSKADGGITVSVT